MANYHAGFTLPNCQMLECSVVPNPLRDELLVEPLRIIDGKMQAPPPTPGLGVVLPDDLETKYPFRRG
jgi:L-alanine-DL-glutamate epimerase-like enolase superfamily enzyme